MTIAGVAPLDREKVLAAFKPLLEDPAKPKRDIT